MTFTITSSCGSPSSGTWTIDIRGAIFEVNTDPASGMGATWDVDEAQWAAATKTWASWAILVPSSGALDITDGPTADCQGT